MDKALRKYIVPNVFAMIGISCYVLADTFFISVASGTLGLAALNLALPVYSVIFAVGAMIGVGSASRYSLSKGMGGEDSDRYFGNALFWTLAISLIFAAAGILVPERVLILMGADDDILSVGTAYMRTVLCFAPCFMLNYSFTAFVRNDGAPGLAMAATLGSSFFNIIFDYILMFPLKMGMLGAALATGLSPVISILITMLHYLSGKNHVRLVRSRPSVRLLVSSCALGIAAFVAEIANAVTSISFNYILLEIQGNLAVAAYGVVANLALVAVAVFNGVSQGLQPLAGEAAGRGDETQKIRIHRQSLVLAAVVSVIFILLLWVFAEPICGVFNREGSKLLADYAQKGLGLYALGFLPGAVNIVNAGFYSAVGEPGRSSVIAFSRGIVVIVLLALLFSRLWGMTGVWLSFPGAETVTLALSVVMGKRPRPRAASQSRP